MLDSLAMRARLPFFLVAVFSANCSSGTAARPACTPGQTQACLGPSSCSGAQFCLGSGAAYSACDCGGADAGTSHSASDAGERFDAGGDPDASGGGTTRFEGSFVITNREDVATIAPYAEITGDLRVEAPGLTRCELPALRRVGGRLVIESNPSLLDVELPRLEHVVGEVALHGNDALGSIGLPNLAAVEGALWAADNTRLSVLTLPRLAEVGGDVTVTGNALLVDVVLTALTTVGGNFLVADNVALTELSALALRSVSGDLTVRGVVLAAVRVTAVTNVGGSVEVTGPVDSADLTSLRTIGGEFVVAGTRLTDLQFVSALEAAPVVRLTSNPRLARVDRLRAISLSSLNVQMCGALLNVALLATTLDDVYIVNNDALTSFEAPALTTVARNLRIGGSPQLATIELPELRSARGVDFVALGALARLDLPRLGSASGFNITDCPRIETIDLPSLRAVDGDFQIFRNATISAFSAARLESIEQAFSVEANPALADFTLPALRHIGRGMWVIDNTSLPTCRANELRDQVAMAAGLGATVIIRGNDDAGGCN